MKALALLVSLAALDLHAACSLTFTSRSSGTLASNEQLDLMWTPVAGAKSYFIERVFGNADAIFDAHDAVIPGTRWTIRHAVLFDTKVRYRVTATNDSDPAFVPCSATAIFTITPDPDLVRASQRLMIPVAGRTAGSNGALFSTKLVLRSTPYYYAPCPSLCPPPINKVRSGRIVFHPMGKPASADDPSIPYRLVDWDVRVYDDVLNDLGASGLGWIEIVPGDGTPAPWAEAWILNGGRNGTRVAGVLGRDYLFNVATVEAFITDPERQRISVGGVTLTAPATFIATVHHPDGSSQNSRDILVPADTLVHLPLADLFPGLTFVRGDVVTSIVSNGIAYVTFTDNTSNDTEVIVGGPYVVLQARANGVLY